MATAGGESAGAGGPAAVDGRRSDAPGGDVDPARTAAVVLVGGQGTRLRPLTLSTPKPMLPTAGVPFLSHLLSRIAAAGIRRVVLGTAYRAEVFAEAFGDGSALGLDLTCAEEPEPRGTGGGIRHAAAALDPAFDEVMVFNGDILSGVDLGAVLAEHRTAGADATLHLVRVPDPTAFGCVPTDAAGRVEAFLEKTPRPPTDQVNAGCYVFRREVVDTIAPDRPVSVERETFPALLERGGRLQGHVDASYWLDLGTPAAFVRGSADLVQGIAPTSALPGPPGTALLLDGATAAASAALSDGTVLGRDVEVGEGSRVIGSVLMDGARVGAGATVVRSVLGPGVVVGDESEVHDAVIGDGTTLGAGCELRHGVRLWPGLTVPDHGLRFSGGV